MRRYESVDPEGDRDLCRFCFPSADRAVLYADEEFYVMPSLGQFVEGYLLVLSRDHRESMAAAAGDHLRRLAAHVSEVLVETYGACCLFEHGRIGSCYRRASERICFHAHLHALPAPPEVLDLVAADFDPVPVATVADLPALRERHPHYLFAASHDGRSLFFPVEEDIERQYLRKRACEALGLPVGHADWQAHPFRERMAATAERLDGRIAPPAPTP